MKQQVPALSALVSNPGYAFIRIPGFFFVDNFHRMAFYLMLMLYTFLCICQKTAAANVVNVQEVAMNQQEGSLGV